ncbi:COP9 signalosome complex subunit 3 [Microdochium nivale]|nr:COP9 signalosome complex subunit 3 [Microdochium nivale]
MQHIATLKAFPPTSQHALSTDEAYDGAVTAHLKALSRLLNTSSADLAIHGPELLKELDPSIHSLSYLAVIHTLVIPNLATSASPENILEKLVTFLLSYDARQIRYAGSHLLDVFTAVGSGHLLPPSVAVGALATAILRLDPSGSILTSAHISLVKLAYNSDNIAPALPVLDKSIVYYPGMAGQAQPERLCDMTLPPPVYISRSTGLTTTLKAPNVLEYDLLCGMAYIARRSWRQAASALERVVTFPTKDSGTSKIMVEAYKKWVLVSLLQNGRHREPPAITGPGALKQYSVHGKAYTVLASLFTAENALALKQEVDNNNAQWAEDGNVGLVQEVLSQYQAWQILNLRDVYSKISVPEIREHTQSAETGAPLGSDADIESLVQNMIISGMLRGVIQKNDDGTSYLTFLPTASTQQTSSELEFARELAATAARLKQLQPIFRATNERLGTNRDYVKHAVKEAKRGTDRGGDGDGMMGFQTEVDDEDLMGGIVATG